MMAIEQISTKCVWQQNEQIKAQFSKSCDSYDGAARLQRLTGAQLFNLNSERLNGDILDLGCGTGINTQLLCGANSQVMACDISATMLNKARINTSNQCHYLQADATALPFENPCFDGIYSNLMVQWLDDLPSTLKQLHQMLKTNGVLCIATLTQGTLQELVDAWAGVDNDNHVNQFLSIDILKSNVEQAGFDCKLETQTITLDYPQVTDLARELKYLGANHVKNRRSKGLMGRGKWQQLAREYNIKRGENGMLPASYQVAYITATKRCN